MGFSIVWLTVWKPSGAVVHVVICLLFAGCPDERPAQLACRVAAGACAILHYYSDVTLALVKHSVNSSNLRQSEMC